MTSTQKYIDRFVHSKDKENPETFRKGRLFLSSIFIIFLIGLPGIIMGIVFKTKIVITDMVAILPIALIVILFFLYSNFGRRVFFANLLCVGIYIAIYGAIGNEAGIYTSTNAWAVVIACWMFLVANRISGFFWFGITFTALSVLYFADVSGFRNFKVELLSGPPEKFFYDFLFSGILIAVIISLYEKGKNRYLNETIIANAELEIKSNELELKNREIVDSLNYARKIQHAVLPHEETIGRNIPLSFILYKPRDIVSGDYFWFHEIDKENYILVCADCTGHGVPGAFMTVIGSSSLNQIVVENKITRPSEILLELDKKIVSTLKQEKLSLNYVPDGMDLSMLKVNKQKNELIFSSAKRVAIFIRNGEIREIKGSKNSLGGLGGLEKKFEEITISYLEDDILYLFTDGYVDQFGGVNNKKFMIKQFRELLLNIYKLPMGEQKQKLDAAIEKWIGKNEQTDDITVIGIKF